VEYLFGIKTVSKPKIYPLNSLIRLFWFQRSSVGTQFRMLQRPSLVLKNNNFTKNHQGFGNLGGFASTIFLNFYLP
jgi:hypothetical protein